MSNKNTHAVTILDNYIKISNPQFALLINSEWGTGKTWFIKNYFNSKNIKNSKNKHRDCFRFILYKIKNFFHYLFKKNHQTTKITTIKNTFCYISLFHMTTVDDIDRELIVQLYSPATYNGAVISSNIILNFIEKNVGKIYSKSITKYLQEYSKKKKNIIVCFDDLERTSINHNHLVGYISNLLEQFGAHVILICNEKNISSDSKLIEYNEKIVGLRTFIEPDITCFYQNYISTFDGNKKNILEKYLPIIIDLFSILDIKNLRIFRTIGYFIVSIFEKIEYNNTITDDTYKKSIIFTLAIYIINKYKKSEKDRLANTIAENMSIANKYNVTFYALYDDSLFWENIINLGYIDYNFIKRSYIDYAQKREEIDLIFTLWHFRDHDIHTITSSYHKLLVNFENSIYTKIGILLHIVGIILMMKKIGIEKRNQKLLTEFIKSKVSKITFTELQNTDLSIGYAGLAFLERNSTAFEKVRSYILSIYREQQEAKTITKLNFFIKKCLSQQNSDSLHAAMEDFICDTGKIHLSNINRNILENIQSSNSVQTEILFSLFIRLLESNKIITDTSSIKTLRNTLCFLIKKARLEKTADPLKLYIIKTRVKRITVQLKKP